MKREGDDRRAAQREATVIMAVAGFAILIWAGVAPATRVVTATIDPVTVGLLRTVGSAAAGVPLILLLRLKGPGNWREWLLLFLAGLGSFAVFPLLFSLGVAWTSASHASFLQASIPIFTGLTAAIVERQRPHRLWWIGAAVALAGEAALITARDRAGIDTPTALGDLVVLTACVCSGASYVAGARLAARITPVAATFWVITVSGLYLLPLLIWRAGAVTWATITWPAWAIIVYLALGANLIAFIAWYWALSRGGISRVAVLQFALPVLSVALAVWFLGETVTPPLLIAGAAILVGIALARRGLDPGKRRD